MSSDGTAKVTMSTSDVAEESETNVEIKIKMMDSQTYTLRVNKCVPVPALKEHIATTTGVLSEQQRLICRGKVLKDDQLLSAYHVEDGHTLHLVVKPPHNSSVPSSSLEGTSSHPANSGSGSAQNHGHIARNFIFETANGEGDIDQASLRRTMEFISSMFNAETPNIRTGIATDELRDFHAESLAALQEMGTERPARTFDASLSSSQPQPNHATVATQRVELVRQLADNHSPSVPFRPLNPTVIPDSLTTLNEYIDILRNEFRTEGFGANGREDNNNAEVSGIRRNEGHTQGGLPSPESLAGILLSARQILVDQTRECLSQLATQLNDHARVTDSRTRMNMQSSAFRSGVLMQNLGSMLLELGRTTMTLRMGQTPSEAVVNAGPANYISASGPNPLMVQPVPFYPGSNIGAMQTRTATPSLTEQPDAAVPRNVEIRIRTVSRAVPAATVNPDQSGVQHPQQQGDMARNFGLNAVRQAFSGMSGGDSGVLVMPMRTVIAVPSGITPSLSDLSGNPVQLLYPQLVGIRHQNTAHASDASNSQASGPHQSGPEVQVSTVQGENPETDSGGIARDGSSYPVNTVPPVPGLSPLANESTGRSSQGLFPRPQRPAYNDSGSGSGSGSRATGGMYRDTESLEAARVDTEQGQLLANILRQLVPLISEGRRSGVLRTNPSPSATQAERENLTGSSSSQHPRDPPEPPSPKRKKSEDK